MKDIKLQLNIQEVNTLLKALGQFPYNQVHELIAKIQAQSTHQLTHTNGHDKHEPAIKSSNE